MYNLRVSGRRRSSAIGVALVLHGIYIHELILLLNILYTYASIKYALERHLYIYICIYSRVSARMRSIAIGVITASIRNYIYIYQSPCTSRSLGEVASSSGGQQAREQKRSAGRQLGGDDDGSD